jgi:cyanophycinase
MKPKGTVLIIGGGEDKEGNNSPDIKGKNRDFKEFEILQELQPNGHKKKRIEIITTASEVPAEMEKMYKAAFRKLGYSNTGFLRVEDKLQARDPDCCKRIEAAHAVLFTGGDQFTLSTILGGTIPVKIIKEKYLHDEDFIVAGTSAGAMAMPKIMIYEGGVNEAMLKDDLKMSSGLGIFDTCIIDTHFIKRGRFGRLANAVIMNPESLGIGLGEDTSLLIRNGTDAVCKGSGMVTIIDGNDIGQTNITEAEKDCPIFVENLKIHLLTDGCRFSIKERKLTGVEKKKRVAA